MEKNTKRKRVEKGIFTPLFGGRTLNLLGGKPTLRALEGKKKKGERKTTTKIKVDLLSQKKKESARLGQKSLSSGGGA